LLFRLVFGAGLNSRAWSDGQSPVNLTATANHRAPAFYSSKSAPPPTQVLYLLTCLRYKLRFI